ncbi:putative cytochrome P450 oxidoreductase [Viridothelium virens]|uniref:Putative cytochrome P450 oxidoreductase n=1 Tax=Viridothelium virens TaxID=1048519 RepID=A0A6A6GWT9_VIRVR|nr:putative cytochrome P450 oxidoreductase [Viridothelium virens]
MSSSAVVPLISLAVFCGVLIYGALTNGHRSRNMPPGPPTLPFIGNALQIPTKYAHFKFTEWARTYGGMYMLKVGNSNIAVITDRRIVKEAVDRKSGIYSHRPTSYVSHDLVTKGDHLLVMYYGNQWRAFRRLMHQHLMESVVESEHINIVNAEASKLVRDYLHDPQNHMLHPKRFSHSIANSIVYGIRTATIRGSYMKRLYDLMEMWSELMETGATPPVDVFPWLKFLPQWMFGNYVDRAKSVGRQMETLYDDILNKVVQRRESGHRLGTFMDQVLDSQEKYQLSWHQLCFIGGILMEGGSDTTATLLLAIVQALTLNPEVQRKAHAEIDEVVGHDRSPTWEDFARLQYINMIVKEGHRWRPILPLCFPHAVGQDDWIDGKFLPKGTSVIINAWGMHMDPSQHRDPDAFIPERYESHSSLAPEYAAGKWEERDHYGYGVGRRICPGIHLAERVLFLAVAKLLWAFRFERGEGPMDSDCTTGYHHGLVYAAKDYDLKTVLRSDTIRETLEREHERAQRDVFSRFSED